MKLSGLNLYFRFHFLPRSSHRFSDCQFCVRTHRRAMRSGFCSCQTLALSRIEMIPNECNRSLAFRLDFLLQGECQTYSLVGQRRPLDLENKNRSAVGGQPKQPRQLRQPRQPRQPQPRQSRPPRQHRQPRQSRQPRQPRHLRQPRQTR